MQRLQPHGHGDPRVGAVTDADARAAVAAAARLVAAAGLAEGFGHVSARAGDAFVITSTAPLALQGTQDVEVPGAPGHATPLEAPLHAAVYAARPDVRAIVRTHSPGAVAWGARGEVPPLVHGLGVLAGRVVVGPGADLVADPDEAAAAAASLGDADCLLPRANGAVCTAPDLPTAVVRAWFLEERARVALAAGPEALPLDGEELRARLRHVPAETLRAWRWLCLRFSDDGTATAHPRR